MKVNTADIEQKPKFEVTPEAAQKIVQFLEDEKKSPAEWGLRLGVKGGGCSGFSYDMRMDSPKEDDYIFEQDGARVFVDPKSINYLKGSRLEYLKRLQGAGFTVVNPNATGSCGCGESVSF